jgi:ElaB/YqjD/DUF883 family membrane-anchored ribosome-binding protein
MHAMQEVLEETTGASAPEIRAGRAGCLCGYDAKEAAKRIEKGVSDAKAAVDEKLEDARIATERLLKRGRYAIEDCLTETAHTIKRHPVTSLAIAFAAGAALGLLVPRSARK